MANLVGNSNGYTGVYPYQYTPVSDYENTQIQTISDDEIGKETPTAFAEYSVLFSGISNSISSADSEFTANYNFSSVVSSKSTLTTTTDFRANIIGSVDSKTTTVSELSSISEQTGVSNSITSISSEQKSNYNFVGETNGETVIVSDFKATFFGSGNSTSLSSSETEFLSEYQGFGLSNSVSTVSSNIIADADFFGLSESNTGNYEYLYSPISNNQNTQIQTVSDVPIDNEIEAPGKAAYSASLVANSNSVSLPNSEAKYNYFFNGNVNSTTTLLPEIEYFFYGEGSIESLSAVSAITLNDYFADGVSESFSELSSIASYVSRSEGDSNSISDVISEITADASVNGTSNSISSVLSEVKAFYDSVGEIYSYTGKYYYTFTEISEYENNQISELSDIEIHKDIPYESVAYEYRGLGSATSSSNISGIAEFDYNLSGVSTSNSISNSELFADYYGVADSSSTTTISGIGNYHKEIEGLSNSVSNCESTLEANSAVSGNSNSTTTISSVAEFALRVDGVSETVSSILSEIKYFYSIDGLSNSITVCDAISVENPLSRSRTEVEGFAKYESRFIGISSSLSNVESINLIEEEQNSENDPNVVKSTATIDLPQLAANENVYTGLEFEKFYSEISINSPEYPIKNIILNKDDSGLSKSVKLAENKIVVFGTPKNIFREKYFEVLNYKDSSGNYITPKQYKVYSSEEQVEQDTTWDELIQYKPDPKQSLDFSFTGIVTVEVPADPEDPMSVVEEMDYPISFVITIQQNYSKSADFLKSIVNRNKEVA